MSPPRGFYIGPYYAYNYLERESYWMVNTNSLRRGTDQRSQCEHAPNRRPVGLPVCYVETADPGCDIYGAGSLVFQCKKQNQFGTGSG